MHQTEDVIMKAGGGAYALLHDNHEDIIAIQDQHRSWDVTNASEHASIMDESVQVHVKCNIRHSRPKE